VGLMDSMYPGTMTAAQRRALLIARGRQALAESQQSILVPGADVKLGTVIGPPDLTAGERVRQAIGNTTEAIGAAGTRLLEAARPALEAASVLPGPARAARYIPDVGEMFTSVLERAGSAITDEANGRDLVRMEHGIGSLYVDPRVVDIAMAADMGIGGARALARGFAEHVVPSAGQASRFGADAQAGVIGGPRAKTANLEKLAEAQKLDERIDSSIAEKRTFIFRKTGWWKGKDGKWRFEIPDNVAELTPKMKDGLVHSATLRDALNHPGVEAAYPGLMEKLKVGRLEIDPGTARSGSFWPSRNEMSGTAPDEESIRNLALHELNHAIGAEEWFSPGGAPQYMPAIIDNALQQPELTLDQFAYLTNLTDKPVRAYRALAGETESRAVERRSRYTDQQLEETPPWTSFDVPESEQIFSDGGSTGRMLSADETPKKTVKAYKLFKVDPKRPGELFPLFVNSDTPVPIGRWLRASEGPITAGGKVKSKIGDLAYRPGWHAGDRPTANHIGGDRVGGKPTTRRSDQVWAEVEMPNDTDWQSVANQRGTNAKGQVVPVKAHITDQMPVGGHYRYKTNSNMTGDWLISGDMKVNRVLSDEEVAHLNAAHGVSDLPRSAPMDWKAHGFEQPVHGASRVNIGLMKGKSGEFYTADEAVSALRELGVAPTEHGVVASGTEPTLVAQLPRPLLPSEMDTLSAKLGQEAIAQKVGDVGALYGPKASEWGPFNDDFFHDLGRLRNMTPADVRAATMHEPDVGSSLIAARNGNKDAKSEPINYDEISRALSNRARYRAEPATTPGPAASEAEWKDWGAKYGVNMTVTPPTEVAPGIHIPGGLDGTFTIPDLFWMKANSFDPKTLPDGMHERLMNKIMRTYSRDRMRNVPVDTFNRLAFGQMSPNAPLLTNEFIASRLRATSVEDLKKLAYGDGDVSEIFGLQAAGKGGLGVRGTPDPNAVRELAKQILENPSAFEIGQGESTRDVAHRLMNSVPLMSQKTGSLSAPLLDIERGSTSAVDLHVIRNNWRSIMRDPEFGPDFVENLAKLFKVEPTYGAIEAAYDAHPGRGLEVVRAVVERKAGGKYRLKGGEVNPRAPAAIRDGRVPEPEQFQDFGALYDRFSRELSSEHIGDLPIFANQWAKWDTYRGRFEPHEFQHPDYALLPKQSFNELQKALGENRKAGFARDEGLPKQPYSGDWRKLYYGRASNDLLALLAASGGGAAAFPLMMDHEPTAKKPETKGKKR
jgi:hypothetical protein